MKKRLSFLLAVLMLLSLAACGDSQPEAGEDGGYLFTNRDSVSLEQPAQTLSPQQIYSKLTYTPQMFYGDYVLPGGEAAEATYAQQTSLIDFETESGKKLTAIPFRLTAGPDNLAHIITNAKNHQWLRAYYYTESGNLTFFLCAYTVEGNTLTLTPLDSSTYDYNKETGHLRYSFREESLSYQFSFDGMYLTLTRGEESITLKANILGYQDAISVFAEGYRTADSPVCDISQINLGYSENHSRCYVYDNNDEQLSIGVAKMTEDGLLTITAPWESGTKTYQFVYFFCGKDGIILTDGDNVYYYTDSYSDRHSSQMGDNLSYEEISKLENMQEDKLEQIIETRADLLEDLSVAFHDAGLNVTVDRQTGEIALDSTVLFAVNEYNIGEEGKAFLKEFMGIYASVVFGEKYSGFVSKVIVEGHTDTTGDYEMNQTLSQARADSVLAYCISEECGAVADPDALAAQMLAEGFSWDKPVYDADGNVDMDASRRVSFRFLINLDA